MVRELEPFVFAIVVALVSAWIVACRVILRVGERWQKVWVWVATIAVMSAGLGYAALIVTDLFGPPKTVTGAVQSLGTFGDPKSGSAYQVVVNGSSYWVKAADYGKLQIGQRIRGQAGAAFNFLQRVEVLPASP